MHLASIRDRSENPAMYDQAIEALIQQLESDQLLGLKMVPIARETLQHENRIATSQRSNSAAPAIQKHAPIGPHSSTAPKAQANIIAPSRPTASLNPIATAEKSERLRILDDTQVKSCRKCVLCQERTKTVFGQGSPDARLMFVGEGPGYDEDKQGLAFVGKAGQLLTKMIGAMGLTRDEVYICNVVKCRPPGNRTPNADEILACLPYLREQVETIQPELIVALGAPASKTLLNTAESISRLRGNFHEYFLSGTTGVGPSIPVMPTFHPAYLLRSPDEKRKAWDDLQQVMQRLGLPLQKSGS